MGGHLLQRKFIDILLNISSKWVNWDPPREIKVGSYGTVDKAGDFNVDGNIYDEDFQRELDRCGVKIKMANFLPQEGPQDDDMIIASRGATRGDVKMDVETKIPGVAEAAIKGEWSFKSDSREAILIMQNPRLEYIPSGVVLEQLYKVDKLAKKCLVTSKQTCPAYLMYLSDKAGDKISLALVGNAPAAAAAGATVGGSAGFSWVTDARSGLLRKASDHKNERAFTPLYSLKRPISRLAKFFRDNGVEPSGDDLWQTVSAPWDPLDEDGDEDPIDAGIRDDTDVPLSPQ